MSYRKLIALTVFGAAVFLQGCDEDAEDPETRCSNSNVIIKEDEDDVITYTETTLFTAIGAEAAKDDDDDVLDEYEHCLACLVDEYKVYHSDAKTDFDADDVDDESCWKTNAAMKACGATADELPDCTDKPCATVPDTFDFSKTITENLGDCALCIGESDKADTQKKYADCGGTLTLEDIEEGCKTLKLTANANGDAAALVTQIGTLSNAECSACVLYSGVDADDCDALLAQFIACKGAQPDVDEFVCEAAE